MKNRANSVDTSTARRGNTDPSRPGNRPEGVTTGGSLKAQTCAHGDNTHLRAETRAGIRGDSHGESMIQSEQHGDVLRSAETTGPAASAASNTLGPVARSSRSATAA